MGGAGRRFSGRRTSGALFRPDLAGFDSDKS